MIGVGTQDGYAKAKEFVARHSLTFRMLWDRGFASWNGFGIQGQPASILVSTDGRERNAGSVSSVTKNTPKSSASPAAEVNPRGV